MKNKGVKLKISTYVYLLITFAIMFVAFLAFMQIDDFVSYSATINNEEINKQIQEVFNEQNEEIFVSGTAYEKHKETRDRQTVIIGDKSSNITALVTTQLSHLRESYYIVENISEIKESEYDKIDVYIVTDTNISAGDVVELDEIDNEDKTILFMNDLTSRLLGNSAYQDVVGIYDYLGDKEFEGYRISSDLAFNTMEELDEVKYDASHVVLTHQTKTYASALLEDEEVKNEYLPPLMWRYISDNSRVYVCNGELFDSPLGYSFITQVYTELQDTYIYPIVNAYMFLVDGMPYVENFESDYLLELYNRDALGMQNSLFFPQFNSSADRYDAKITWYSPEYDKVMSSNDEDIKYYVQESDMLNNEIAKNEDDKLISDKDLISNAVLWSDTFSFVDDENKEINIPIMIESDEFDIEKINSSSMAKSVGLMSLYVDVSEFLTDNDKDWVEFCLDYESILGYDKVMYPWIDRVNASEATKRITAFLSIEPTYIFEEDRAIIDIGNFNSEAHFIMHTREEIKEVKNAEFEEIGNDLYLIEAKAETVEVYYEDNI